MTKSREYILAEIATSYGWLHYLEGEARNEWDSMLHAPTTLQQVLNAWPYLVDCLDNIIKALNKLAAYNAVRYEHDYPMAEYLNFYTGVITWETIVEAWVAADLEGVKFTIGILDYMRKAVWNEPYNMKFYKPATEFWK